MSKATRRIPPEFHTITPYITVRDCARAIDFYKKAFGAREVLRHQAPDGASIWHARIMIGDSLIMMNDEFPETGVFSPLSIGGSAVTLHVYVEDADAAYKRAIDAGAAVTMPIQDTFWGDRYAQVTDPFGHHWSIAHKLEDVSPEESRRRAAAQFGS